VSDQTQARPRRHLPRDPLAVVVKLQPGDLAHTDCQVRNVSVGGMFLQSPLSPALFSGLTISLTLPSGLEATLEARVVHVLGGEEARRLGFPPGFGVKFERLDSHKLDVVHHLVEWARQTEKDEYAEYLERAQWLQTAEAMRASLSMRPPPPGSPEDAGAQAPNLRDPSLPAESAHARKNAPGPNMSSQEPPTTRMRGVRSELTDVRGKAKPMHPATAPRHAQQPASRPPSVVPPKTESASPSAMPNTARLRGTRPPSARPARNSSGAPLGAAGQLLAQAEAAYAGGQVTEASRDVKLLSAMTFDDPRIQARVAELKLKVQRAAAVDFEKQAAYDERHQHWGPAAQAWLRVAEGRPNDSAPLQRAALAQLQAGVEPRAILETAKRAVELAPNDAQARRTLAKVYMAADMQASARRELQEASRCSAASAADESTPTGFLKRLLGRDNDD
jgi:PilZ domain